MLYLCSCIHLIKHLNSHHKIIRTTGTVYSEGLSQIFRHTQTFVKILSPMTYPLLKSQKMILSNLISIKLAIFHINLGISLFKNLCQKEGTLLGGEPQKKKKTLEQIKYQPGQQPRIMKIWCPALAHSKQSGIENRTSMYFIWKSCNGIDLVKQTS